MNFSLRDLILSVGTRRGDRPLSPLEVAEALAAHSNEVGWQQALNDISLEKSTAQRFLTLRSLDKDVAELVDWGRRPGAVSFSVAAEIARVIPEDQRILARAALEHSLTKEEVRQVVQLMKRRGDSVDSAVAATLQMRPSVVNVHVTLGAVSGPVASGQLEVMTQRQRDELLARVLAKVGIRTQGGKLTTRAFSIVSDMAIPDNEVERIERLVNDALAVSAKD
ncbi:hypothetical protein [Geodermatophilus normandii]|uniref:hypothetical protein n=1 Tax=Geodermatophilus normandii TaxID=1137989 RepID=UPI0011B53DA9|nr:hypothetical protein [Geodermatophilus normandii]